MTGNRSTGLNNHRNLLLRLYPDSEAFKALYYRAGTKTALAAQEGISYHEVQMLLAHYDIPKRLSLQPRSARQPVDLDVLAERFFEKLMPRLRQMMDDRCEAWFK